MGSLGNTYKLAKKPCIKGKSRTPKKSVKAKSSIKPHRSLCIMSKKFTFKPPASVAPRPLSVATVPSVQASQGSQHLAKPMEELWLDDIDEDMLVQASQMAEGYTANLQSNTERMEMDTDAVKQYIQEDDKIQDDWTSHQSQRTIQQTQTVFHNKSSFFASSSSISTK